MDPLGVLSFLQRLWDRVRRVGITLTEWEWVDKGPSNTALRIGVVNKGTRPVQIRDAGTIHQGSGYQPAASVEGVPIDLTDGQSGELVLIPRDHEALGLSPPARVWVGLATGERRDAPFPPRPEWSTGDNVNGDF